MVGERAAPGGPYPRAAPGGPYPHKRKARGGVELQAAIGETRIRSLLAGIAWLSANLLMIELLAARQWNVAVGEGGLYVLIPTVMAALSFGAMLAIPISRRFPQQIPQYCVASFIGFIVIAPLQFLPYTTLAIDDQTRRVLSHAFPARFYCESGAAAAACYLLWGCGSALAFRQPSGRLSTLYGVSLLGAAVGAPLGAELMNHAARAQAIAITVAAGAVGGALLLHWARPPRVFSAAAIALLTVTSAGSVWGLAQYVPAHIPLPGTVWRGSNAISEVEAFRTTPLSVRSQADAFTPEGAWLADDLGIPDGIEIFNLVMDDRPYFSLAIRYPNLTLCGFLRQEIGYQAFEASAPKRALILGSGGGREVLEGAIFGCPSITAVEVNPLMVQAARSVGSAVYDDPCVHVAVSEARQYVSHYEGPRFDLVMLPYVKKFSNNGLGNDYLLTMEGLKLALRVLAPHGMLAIRDEPKFSRMYARTLAAAASGLNLQSAGHLVHIRNTHSSMLIYAASGFGPDSVQRLGTVRSRGFGVGAVVINNPRERFRTDDLPALGGEHGDKRGENLYLLVTLLLCGGFVICTVTVPGLRLLREGVAPSRAQLLPFCLYFGALGAGFVIVELIMLEKVTLYLGEPMFASSLALAALLVSSGLGSMTLGRADGRPSRRTLMFRAACAIAAVCLGFAIIDAVSRDPHGSGIVRWVTSGALMSAQGFCMGTLFPLGLQELETRRGDLTLWMYGVNGAAAALAGVATRYAVYRYGFHAAMAMGVAVYGLAALSVPLMQIPRAATGAVKRMET